jgi:hypothetical protein
MRKDAAMFTYWKDGSTQIEVHADPPAKGEAKPFHVMARSKSYIPVSILVFARDAEHAKQRVIKSIAECAEKQYTEDASYGVSRESKRRGQTLLDGILDGTFTVTVDEYDVTRISCRVEWASNGGVLT